MVMDQSISGEPQGRLAQGVLIAALVAGGSYLFGMNADLNPSLMLAWKGAGVWLLAIYAGLMAHKNDGWLIAFVMGMGALGDVLLERSITAGAGAFLVGHVAAIYLYLTNRRKSLSQSQRWLTIVAVPAILIIAWGLTKSGPILIYTLFLAMMAASAWASRFPRYWTGIGAMLFVVSDLLIFARMGVLEGVGWISPAIWILYFGGQVLIVLGVTRTLARG
jgi:uncharacterized membrane protein YhhN